MSDDIRDLLVEIELSKGSACVTDELAHLGSEGPCELFGFYRVAPHLFEVRHVRVEVRTGAVELVETRAAETLVCS